MAALFGTETHGRTPALSLRVYLEDIEGQDLYIDQGGLQLYEKPHGRNFEQIADAELYADPERNAKSVQLALRALLTRTPSDTASKAH